MAVPRNRHSKARKNSRRAHHALRAKSVTTCLNCGGAVQPHRACGACGHYRGKQLTTAKASEVE